MEGEDLGATETNHKSLKVENGREDEVLAHISYFVEHFPIYCTSMRAFTVLV